MPGHALYISDPMLETCADLGLGWYIGTVLLDCTDDIADLIPGTAQRLGVAERNIVFYDSSGGGFAALLALRWFPLACAVAINPLTPLTAFWSLTLTTYVVRFFGGITKDDFAQTYPT